MEYMLDVEPKRSYSSWCERHVSPKNSKWLQDNLTDMDNKIKAMIKLIEEDADSFARRAEMYYKKRPDLMKLVEQFYRAYRALAERYDRVTGALRQAHRTIAVAFPNEIQLMLPDEPPSVSFDIGDEETCESGSHAQLMNIQWNGKSLGAIAPLIIKEGLKHFNCFFADEEAQQKFGDSLVMKIMEFKEDEAKDSKCKLLVEETEKLLKEKEDLQDQIATESMRADNAQAELQILKDAISKLKSELEAAVARYQASQKTISNLELEISKRQEEFQHLSDEMRIKTSKLNIAEERCAGLERKNASLNVELDKLNRVVSRQQEEVSDCFKENKDLQIRFNSEAKRADQAEAESSKLRDVISKLKSEMESALLQYHVSQEKISELEAEISHSKEQFRSACAEMSTGASKLNLAEAKCLLLQEENKSLRDELEKFKKRVTSQEEVITRREEEFNELQQSLEEECNRNMLAEIKEKSLQLQINKLEKTVAKQEEELAMKEKELDRLNEVINDECKQRLNVERAHQSMVEMHAEYEEKMELLCLEVQDITEKLGRVELTKAEVGSHPDCENNGVNEEKYSSVSKIKILQEKITSLCLLVHKLEDELQCSADKNVFHQHELSTVKNEKKDLSEAHHELTDKLRRMELRETGLEEEMRHLHDENRSLNEKKFSSLSKIVCLQDEIILLKESKYRLEDELKFQDEEKKVLQQEILSLKNERSVLEERHNEIVAQIEEVNFNVISLQAEMKEMHDGNKELQDTCNRYEDEKAIHAHQLNLMESIMEKNAVLENSLSDTNAELKILLAKIKGLEEYCQSLHGIVLSHMSVKPATISHVEAVTYNMEKLTEKNTLLENFISNLNDEFEVLRRKVKTLEESCQSLYCQKSFLIADNGNLISQVKRVGLHLKILENRLLISEGTSVNQEDKDPFQHIEELKCPLRACKDEHDDHESSFKSQISYLGNQIHFLREENKIIKEELEETQYNFLQSDIDRFIFEQCLTDLNEKCLFLLEQCQKYMEESKRVENFFLEFKEEWASREKDLASLSDCNEKLLDGLHVMIANDAKKAYESSNNGSDNMLHLILNKIADLQASILVSKDETLTIQEIFFLQKKNHELLELNEQLWKDLDTSRQHEEMLNIELEFLYGRLSDLQDAGHAYDSEILKLLEEHEFLSQTLYEFRERNSALEIENTTILENAMTQEHLSLIFRNYNAEKALEIEWLIKDVNYLYRVTNDLGQEIRVVNKSMRALEAENMHIKEEFKTHIGLLEDKIHKARSTFGRLNLEPDAGKQLLEQREKQPFNAEKGFQGIQIPEVPMKFGKPFDENEETKVVREEFERYVSLLSEDGACKNHDIGFQHHSNEMLREELYKLQKVVENLRTRENNLASELQMATEKLRHYNKDSVKLLDELHAASIMELIFKEKLIEIMQTFNSIDIVQFKMPTEEAALRNVLEDYKGKFVSLESENKRLKAELNAYVPLVASLESEMASLEEKTLALTNLHILNSKRKQGNLLASLKRKKSIQMRGQHNSPRASAGIMELKKLRGKVKVLQKAVTDTERHLDEGCVHSDANVNLSTTKSKARVKSRSMRSVQAQKDIILDLRNDVDNGNNSDDNILLKDDDMLSRVKHEQMKDIELDHVLSSCGLEPSFSVKENDLAVEVWKPGIETDVWYDNISKMDVERSEKPSDELVLLKETSVDNLAYPACCTESHQAWIKWVNCSVSADARRLVALQNCLKELKISIQASDMKCQLSISELNAIKTGVKEAEGGIKKLTDFNYKLSKMAMNFTLSSDSKKSRRKALEQIQSASEKITALDLKLQKLCCILSNLQEGQQEERKAIKGIFERRSRIPLKDLIYGKRSDLRQKKRRFCACMRLKRTDSNLT